MYLVFDALGEVEILRLGSRLGSKIYSVELTKKKNKFISAIVT